MRREFSAGGVVVRNLRGRPVLAAIRPAGKPKGTWALPKGLIGAGERAEVTALREVHEETGVEATPFEKLGDVRYVYTWDGQDASATFRRSTSTRSRTPAGCHSRRRPSCSRTRASERWRQRRWGGSRVRLRA